MISLDATSLFTNVQIGLAHKAVKDRFDDIKLKTKIPAQHFLAALRVCTKYSNFNFQGTTYKQKSGFPMGSPISPIISDIVMDDLEQQCLQQLPFQVPFYFRFVDDIFTAVPIGEINTILNVFNNYNHKLQFTIEKESQNKISFLDVLLLRKGEEIITNWYRKPTSSDRILNFHSNHAPKYKINVINNLVDRGILLSSKQFHKDNIEKIKDILSKNCYPTHFINNVVDKRLRKIKNDNIFLTSKHIPQQTTNAYSQTTKNTDSQIQCEKYFSLPYVKGFSEKLSGVLKPFNVSPAYRNIFDLSAIFKTQKDNIEKIYKTNIVYEISCNDCESAYIGTTKRPLKTRIKEHKKDVYKKPDNWTALTKHA